MVQYIKIHDSNNQKHLKYLEIEWAASVYLMNLGIFSLWSCSSKKQILYSPLYSFPAQSHILTLLKLLLLMILNIDFKFHLYPKSQSHNCTSLLLSLFQWLSTEDNFVHASENSWKSLEPF